jgi:hypothetical protein
MDGKTSGAALLKAHLLARFLLSGELYMDNAINKKLKSKRKLRSGARTREDFLQQPITVVEVSSTQSASSIAKLLQTSKR